MSLAIVIPAYNEAATIGRVVESVKPFGTVIVVNDCSKDGTPEIAEKAGATVVTHAQNKGYEGALQSGFEKAAALGVDFVITFDADGQHDTTKLQEILALLEEGSADIVIGIRPEFARASEALFGWYTNLRYGVKDILCGLKGFNMKLYHEHGCFDSYKSIGTELPLWAMKHGKTFTTVEVPIHDREDQPRLGRIWRANRIIFTAMMKGVRRDLLGWG